MNDTMRGNKSKGLRRLLCILLVAGLLAGSVDMSSVRAEQAAEVADGVYMTGQAGTAGMEKIWQTERCIITFLLADCWEGGYNAVITVQNVSDEVIDNWHVSASVEEPVRSVWNAQMLKGGQGETVFKNLGWNQDIAPGESVSFGFTAEESFDGFPEFCELSVVKQAVSDDNYEITYEVTNAWESGYNGSLRVLNKSDRVIEDWQLSFDCASEITDLWNGEIISREAGKYLVKNREYNQNIAPDGVVTVGFTVQDGSAEELPGNFVLEEFALRSGISSGGDSGKEPEGTHDGGTAPVHPGGEGEQAVLTIDTDGFDLNEVWEMYLTEERLSCLSGTLKGAEQADKLSYVVRDVNDVVVSSGEVEAREFWQTEEIGLVLGINSITVTAWRSQDPVESTTGFEEFESVAEASIILMNFNQENMEAADVDLSDTDGDGLNNYFESIYGTDPLLADTDGDGLTDWEELTQTGTNPLLEDTDGNSILDGAEDFDGDGLSNQEEIAAGTGVLYPDSDGDGLSDGEEVLVYHTNPLVADTDGDGLSDGEDIKLGFDPLKPDTDENGILDGDEVVYQTCTQELDPERKEGITQISVSMDCAGYIDNQVLIQNLYNLDMRSTDVVGLFGAPVEIETEIEFDTATITFTYDEQALGETDADNLRIMWYDEEDDRYVILDEETVLDKEQHTLSCSTTHFSKWMVVDRQVWWTEMRADLGYGEYYFDWVYAYNWGQCMDEHVEPLPDNRQLYYYYGESEDLDTGKTLRHIHHFEKTWALEMINLCIDWVDNGKSPAKNKQIYFFDLKDIEYDPRTVQRAIDGGIAINFITASNNRNTNMMRVASETGGKYLEISRWNNYDITTAIYNEIMDIQYELQSYRADGDRDGLYDIYEEKGFRLSNGRIVYTSPQKYDSDDDGINDFLYVGGLPIAEKYTVDGEEFTSTVNRGGVYPELSADFIYVDGRVNANGMVNDERMGYVSYSNQFYYDKYEKPTRVKFAVEERWAEGAAGVHGLFADKLANTNEYVTAGKYASLNASVALAMLLGNSDANILHCFCTYTNGKGGPEKGCTDEGSRDYIPAYYMLCGLDCLDLNSARSCFKKNLQEAMRVAEAVLNENNTEIYIALSPDRQWAGCNYVNYSDFNIKDPFQVVTNMAAFGIFNSADASITLHCTYNSETKKYRMEYTYYIVDFYDFSFYDWLYQEDALGLARSYELFGVCPGILTWEKGKMGWAFRTGF